MRVPSNRHGACVKSFAIAGFMLVILVDANGTDRNRELELGRAGHAFDHLGNIGEQSEAAVASGATIIYATGLGGVGYSGLPAPGEFAKQRSAAAAYLTQARKQGIRLALGYVCATSIVKLETFDRHWPNSLRRQLRSPPGTWRQQDRHGAALSSWYGGDYQPACMNHPDWRTYQKFVIRQQLETGCNGIFFDNPTVHPKGCYCPHCMRKFHRFLGREGVVLKPSRPTDAALEFVRDLADKFPEAFRRFRSGIARDFFAEMREYARSIKSGSLITANNSLNSVDVLFSQSQTYGYNIFEMSRAEDYVVVEDMSSQPRRLKDGRVLEYGPTFKQLQAISHGKPIVGVSLAEGDYHTPPNLVRLALAEAAAHRASHLWWPTWPVEQRQRMAATIRPQADFLRRHADLLKEARPRADVALFLAHKRWVGDKVCGASAVAAALTRANIQYEVFTDEALDSGARDGTLRDLLRRVSVLILPQKNDFTGERRGRIERLRRGPLQSIAADVPQWLEQAHAAVSPSIRLHGPPEVRVIVADQKKRTVLHLYNLAIERVSSFEDKIAPAADLAINVRTPFTNIHHVRLLSADADPEESPLSFAVEEPGSIRFTVPHLEIAALVVIE